MVQELQQRDIFGSIGKGFGRGLAEQLPKEMERGRLSAGLKDLSQNAQNLTPLEQFARVASIPGVTPQMIQALPDILKQQNIRNAYAKKSGPTGGRPSDLYENKQNQPSAQQIKDLEFANIQQQENRPSKSNIAEQDQFGQPQVVEKNPLREEAIPKIPWTQQRRDEEISNVFEDIPGITLEEARRIASENEQRELSRPLAEQQQDEYLKNQKKEIRDEFNRQLQTKLQTDEKGVFKDITGENIINLERNIERDLRNNPKASVSDIVNKWTGKALELAKTKTQLKTLSESNFFDKINSMDKLKTYQKIFDSTGNSEEFYNLLQSQFDMSPQGSASLAYPRSSNAKNYIEKVKTDFRNIHNVNRGIESARKHADNIKNIITSKDSLLAIARDIKHKDPHFNENAFFNFLRENLDELPLTSRQKKELASGESSMLPQWGDILILPVFREL